MAKQHSGHDLARFFRREAISSVTPAEQAVAKVLFQQIAGDAFDHRTGSHPVTINTVSNDTDFDYDTMIKVADRFAEAASKLAENVRKFNGHATGDGADLPDTE